MSNGRPYGEKEERELAAEMAKSEGAVSAPSELAKHEIPPPAPYRALWAATDGLVREIVELHGPVPQIYPRTVIWRCEGCEANGYEWEYPDWPCETSGLIAHRVGVSLRDEDYVVEQL